jgi:hypothetical protein
MSGGSSTWKDDNIGKRTRVMNLSGLIMGVDLYLLVEVREG